MTSAVYIISGATRGLGLGMARAVVTRGGHLIALGRSETPELAALAGQASSYRFVSLDLAQREQCTSVAEELFGSLAALDWDGVYLFNNAGLVEPVAPAGQYGDADLLRCLDVNLTAAMQLGNAFIRHFQHHRADKRMLNISSGAGRNAYPSWSAYCTAKAGLDMYSRCIGVEQQERANGIRCAAIAPGIIDTGMQASIRSHSNSEFAMVEQFKAYKENGELSDPDLCGTEMLAVLHGSRMGFGDLLSIRDFR